MTATSRLLPRGALDERPTRHQRRVHADGHHLFEVAGVVDVVVGDEHPLHVFGLHEREGIVEPLLVIGDGPGVDDHRLGTGDDHRVDVHRERGTQRGLHLVDEVSVEAHALGFDAVGRRYG